MFWGCQLSETKGAKLEFDEEIEEQEITSLHITNVVLGPE